jgi:hypothetical protein
VIGLFVFFLSLLLVPWDSFWVPVTVAQTITIKAKYQGWGCGLWMFKALRVSLFQLTVSPFNWIDRVIKEIVQRADGR